MLLGVVLALLTAVSNAASNVLQRKADREGPEDKHMSLRLIWSLLHRKVWLAGLAAVIAAFLLQAGALRFGQLALVQPIVVIELPLTLIAASLVFRSRLHRREWLSIAMMTAGLAALIGFLDPSQGGRQFPSDVAWAIGTGTSVTAVVILVLAAGGHARNRRAAMLGAATGIAFGLTAAFTKSTMAAISGGADALFSSWTLYAMAAAGFGAMFLMQNALQVGRLVAAQPGITLLDPFVAILFGVFAFGERTAHGPLLAASAVGAALMIAGAVLLSRSPLLESEDEGGEGTTGGNGPATETAASAPVRARERAVGLGSGVDGLQRAPS